MSERKLTARQKETLARCLRARENGGWYRAAGSGERVTLASLYGHGILVRRAHRGIEGSANAAHEYRPSELVMATWRATCAAAVATVAPECSICRRRHGREVTHASE